MRLAAALLVAALAQGCTPGDPFTPSGCSDDDATVGGSWVITGSGTRSHCRDAIYDGSFSLRSTESIPVEQEAGVLRLANPNELPDVDLSLAGTVSGCAVSLEIKERFEAGSLVYTFQGQLTELGDVSGSFTGEGPSGCTSKGTFRVAITR
jgi:hypothetical protein